MEGIQDRTGRIMVGNAIGSCVRRCNNPQVFLGTPCLRHIGHWKTSESSCFSGTFTIWTRRGVIKNAIAPWNKRQRQWQRHIHEIHNACFQVRRGLCCLFTLWLSGFLYSCTLSSLSLPLKRVHSAPHWGKVKKLFQFPVSWLDRSANADGHFLKISTNSSKPKF